MTSRATTSRDVAAAAAAFWQRECARYDVDPTDPKLVGATAPLRSGGEEILGDAPAGTAGAAWLGDLHLSSLARTVRSQHGRFYTPPALASALAARALSERDLPAGSIVDPACGAGALLAAAAEHLVGSLPARAAVDEIACRLRGTDLDPAAARLCDLAVRVALLPAWAELRDADRPELPQFARVRNGLTDAAAAAVVLANPPFGRRPMSPRERDRHRAVLYGHAHWPTLFLHTAVERLVPNGVAAFVLPASLVGGAYYQRLRAYLAEHAPPEWLGFVDQRDGVFAGGVLQETLLATFVRGRMVADVEVERIGDELAASSSHVFSARAWRRNRSWLIPRDSMDVSLVAAAAERRMRLSDYGWSVSTGPLVWNRHREQLFDDPGPGRVPVVWGSDIRGGAIDLSEARSRRFVVPRADQPWLVLDTPAVLIQRTTAPEQPRRLVVGQLDAATLARAGGRVVVENHVNVCRWNGAGPLTPGLLVAYLGTEEADRLYRCMTGSVAVSAFELRQLPLPDPSELSAAKVAETRAA